MDSEGIMRKTALHRLGSVSHPARQENCWDVTVHNRAQGFRVWESDPKIQAQSDWRTRVFRT